MHRKDRVYEALRSLSAQRPTQSSVLRRHRGFNAEEVAERAEIDRTNASRDLNLLVQEGIIERIPGRPVLFTMKATTTEQETNKATAIAQLSAATTPAPPAVSNTI
ncbi:MAG TPA: helix-turn-helix domain-containing protein, partial [Ktedonobacteraceae bacterium]|nr:helix-turn-helix domain-containing protein [Ktedonobacteraceae bacterium]